MDKGERLAEGELCPMSEVNSWSLSGISIHSILSYCPQETSRSAHGRWFVLRVCGFQQPSPSSASLETKEKKNTRGHFTGF